jgi:hypothetical protein
MAHQPSLDLQYASTEEIEALPERDQKLYAEIIYSWLITRADQIKEVDGGLSVLRMHAAAV